MLTLDTKMAGSLGRTSIFFSSVLASCLQRRERIPSLSQLKNDLLHLLTQADGVAL